MRVRGLGFVVLFALTGAVATNVLADFEPLFQVIRVTGECAVQRPGENNFVPAEESKAYPYGTKVQTGMRSSLVIVFSEGNVCRVLANAMLTMDEGIKNKKLKIIRLQDGEVEVELLEDFHKDGNALNVETATAICGAIGCKFRVASKVEEDLRIVIVRVIEGLIRLHGENFDATTLGQDDWISLLSPPDRSFLRLKTMKGDFDIKIKGEDLQDKVVPTVEGTVLKIWQRQVPGTGQRVVTSVLTGPDGQLIETVTVTYGEGDTPGCGGDDDDQTPPWSDPDGDLGTGTGTTDDDPQPRGDDTDRPRPRVDARGPEGDPDPDAGNDDADVGIIVKPPRPPVTPVGSL